MNFFWIKIFLALIFFDKKRTAITTTTTTTTTLMGSDTIEINLKSKLEIQIKKEILNHNSKHSKLKNEILN